MIVYYAAGGGLGHLTRARALLHTLGKGPAAIVTASPLAGDPRLCGAHRVVPIPAAAQRDGGACRAWLAGALRELRPEEIYIDAFPGGLLGEWCDLPAGVPVHHVARLLRWQAYRAVLRGEAPSFSTTYLLEPIEEEHERFLRERSARLVPLALTDPPEAEEAGPRRPHDLPGDRPLWLVVHAGPPDEIAILLDYARDTAALEARSPLILLLSPSPPPALPAAVLHRDLYPVTSVFPVADRIITGCGFNVMRQLAPYRGKHRFLPFPRRFDDQFVRAARHRGF